MTGPRILLCYILLLYCALTDAKLSCKNDQGEDVDWNVFYKLPSLPDPEKLIDSGEAYANLDLPAGIQRNNNGDWVLSNHSVEDVTSIFGRTYSQVLDKRTKLAYLIYNDEDPGKESASSYYGHVKGIVVTDGVTGFWLSHSVPKFPNDPAGGHYDYPDTGKTFGQSGICITFKFEMLPNIVQLLKYSRPNIYAKKSIPEVDRLPRDVSDFFRRRVPNPRKGPWNITTTVTSMAGHQFITFAKHKKWKLDLYDDAVAPNLQVSLYAETWRSGSGGKLPADCVDKYTVYNVDEVDIDYEGPGSVTFKRTHDHSKWVIAQEGQQPWVCIGDLNRMASQRKRGGGAICFKNEPAWNVYKKSISQFEGCSLKRRMNNVLKDLF